MKTILYVILFSITNFSCLQKKSTKSTKDVESNSIRQLKEEVIIEKTNICQPNSKDIELYKRFISEDTLIFLTKIGGRLYHGSTKDNFNKLFQTDEYSCIIPVKGDNLNIYDIQYGSNIDSKKIFIKIKSINRTTINLNAYHDFFKRGLIFIHSQEKNKITVIAFNPFLNNKLPKKFKVYFNNNKKLFENVFMTMGIGNVDELISS